MNPKMYVILMISDCQELFNSTDNPCTFQIIKIALDLNRLNFLNNDRIGSVMNLISRKGRLPPEVGVPLSEQLNPI